MTLYNLDLASDQARAIEKDILLQMGGGEQQVLGIFF
jgi:hypothetical protein